MPSKKTSMEHTSRYWSNHFENFIRPLLQENTSLKVKRANGLAEEASRDDLVEMVNSPLVIADLTDLSPEVYWQLGARQSFRGGTITIAEEGTDVPFSSGTLGPFFYSNDFSRMVRFLEDFKDAVEGCVKRAEASTGEPFTDMEEQEDFYEKFALYDEMKRTEVLIKECRDNMEIIRSVVEQNLANKGNTSKYLSMSEQMKIDGMDYLITKRYIEKSHYFYILAEECFAGLQTYAETVVSWVAAPEEFEEWLIVNGNNLLGIMDDFTGSLEQHHAGLKSRM